MIIVNPAYCKAGKINSEISCANAQFRRSGILIAPAIGKLYFECLKMFSVPENTCSCRERKMLPKSAFFGMYNVNF